MTTVFLIIGGVGLAILAASLLFGELLQLGDFDADGPFSVATIAAFLGAFGFGAEAASALLPDLGGLTLLIAVVAGLIAAIPAAWLAIRLTRAVMDMRTDATLTRQDLLGASGVVLTRIPADGYGEVRLSLAGQQIKYNARAEQPIPAGSAIFVISAPTETSVVVEPTETLLPDG
ncbi:MAG: NfeD family protein [Micromonosporaceae bacterium]